MKLNSSSFVYVRVVEHQQSWYVRAALLKYQLGRSLRPFAVQGGATPYGRSSYGQNNGYMGAATPNPYASSASYGAPSVPAIGEP
jgi:hypothetical protein